MQTSLINLLNTGQNKNNSSSFQDLAKNLIRPQFYSSAFIPFAIPGFGPVVVEIIVLPAIISGLTYALSRGANESRLIEVINLPKPFCCYQSHPESIHQHTMSLDDLPYPKKLKIANAANNVFNAIGEIICTDRQTFCKKYVEARDHFYNTINHEYKGCKEDYYNIIARDAIREAWFKCDFENNISQALKQIEDAIQTIKSSTNILYNRLPVDLITAKTALHYIAGDLNLSLESLNELVCNRLVNSSFNPRQREFVSKQMNALAIEGYINRGDLDLDDPLSLLAVIALRYLCESQYSNNLKGDFHIGKLIVELLKALYDNLMLIEENNRWDILSHALAAGFDPKDFSSINLKVLKGLMQDFTPSAIQTDDLTVLFNYNYNSSKIFMNYKVFEFCVKKFASWLVVEQKKVQQTLKEAVLDRQDPSLYFVKEEADCSHQLVLFDTTHSNLQDSKLYYNELKNQIDCHGISVIHHPYKSTRGFFYPSNTQELKNQIAIDLIYDEIFKKVNQSSCQKLTLSCHSYGLEIIQEALKMLPKELFHKIELVVFSPTTFASDLNGIKVMYYLHVQDTLSQMAVNSLYNSENPEIYLLNDIIDSQNTEKLDSIYKNQLISLLKRQVSFLIVNN